MTDIIELKPCPFCGGSVKIEETLKGNSFGVICRNTLNLGGTCAIQQIPSVTKEAAIKRWNTRAQLLQQGEAKEPTVKEVLFNNGIDPSKADFSDIANVLHKQGEAVGTLLINDNLEYKYSLPESANHSMDAYNYFAANLGVGTHQLFTYPPATQQKLDKAREALQLAQEKLEVYRKHSTGEYQGGMEYTHLMTVIEQALKETE